MVKQSDGTGSQQSSEAERIVDDAAVDVEEVEEKPTPAKTKAPAVKGRTRAARSKTR